MKTIAITIAALALASQSAQAQTLNLNEIYASHSGTDDREMMELIGTPAVKLDGYMVLIVEGDSSNPGTLDRAWDLTGNTMPPDGYFVLGDDAVTNVDMKIGASNRIENGTDTFYLVKTSDPSKIIAMVGTDLDPDGDLKTTIPGLATIVDIIAMADGGITSGDKIYDGAQQLGPDGTFLPAGVFRDGDFPDKWCDGIWHDLDYVADANAMRTPGTKNSKCA